MVEQHSSLIRSMVTWPTLWPCHRRPTSRSTGSKCTSRWGTCTSSLAGPSLAAHCTSEAVRHKSIAERLSGEKDIGIVCCGMLWYVMLCCVMLCCCVLCYVILCYVMLYYMLRCSMLCYGLVCYAIHVSEGVTSKVWPLRIIKHILWFKCGMLQ